MAYVSFPVGFLATTQTAMQPPMQLYATSSEASSEVEAPASHPMGMRADAAKPSPSMLRRRRRQRAVQARRPEDCAPQQQRAFCPEKNVERAPMKPAPRAPLGFSRPELSEALAGAPHERAAAITSFRGRMEALSFDAQGCHAVQELLLAADSREVAPLVSELKGRVRDALRSPYANYVLQKVVEVMPVKHSLFIIEELRGAGASLACHRYGCRIFCRLLEHASSHAEPSVLVDEVLEEAAMVARHAFGHYVIQAVLEHGLPRQRRVVAETLCEDLLGCSRNRHTCYVLEDALAYCCPEDRKLLLEGFSAMGLVELVSLAQDIHGSYVLRAVFQLSNEGLDALPGRIGARLLADDVAPLVQATKYGRRVLEDLRAARF